MYRPDEDPRIGDIIHLFDGPYGTAAVVKWENWVNGKAFILHRVHTQFKNETPVVATETVLISEKKLREFPVYGTGPKGAIDNRNY